jgi:hypothetical protein
MVTMTVSQARAALPDLLTRVEEGEEVTITRHGRPIAILVRPDIMRRRAHVVIEDAALIHDFVSSAGGSDIADQPGLSAKRAESLVRQIREGRDRR